MRIAFITTSLDPGGAETSLANLARGLTDLGASISIVALRGSGRLADGLPANGVATTSLNATSALKALLAMPRALHELRRHRPDVVQGWMYHGNLAATSLAPLCGARLLWGVRQALGALDQERPATNRLIRLAAKMSRRPERIVYNSERARRDHEAIDYCALRSVVIANGFDIGTFRPDESLRAEWRRRLRISEGSVLVGHVARYHPVKDHKTFLQSAARLQNAPSHFALAGRGVDIANQDLVDMVSRLGLSERVTLLGEIDNVAAFYPCLDVLCLSSRSEAFPNVIGEAMSCGIPCVATDIGDVAQIIGGTGKVVPIGDSTQFAEALRFLIEKAPEERTLLGTAARERIREHYSLRSMIERYSRLYGDSRVGPCLPCAA